MDEKNKYIKSLLEYIKEGKLVWHKKPCGYYARISGATLVYSDGLLSHAMDGGVVHVIDEVPTDLIQAICLSNEMSESHTEMFAEEARNAYEEGKKNG